MISTPAHLRFCCFLGLWLISISGTAIAQGLNLTLRESLEITLVRDPELQRQKLQVDISAGNLQIAESTFDFSLNSRLFQNNTSKHLFMNDPLFTTYGLNRLESNNHGLGMGFQQTFGTGLMLRPGLDLQRYRNNVPVPGIPLNSPVLSLYGIQPLLKGGGKKTVTALRTWAGHEYKAELFQRSFVTSQRVLNSMFAYWEYRAAWESQGIYKENEDRVRKMFQVTQSLVNADKKPASDLVQVDADLADKTAQRIEADRRLYEGRQNLGRAIGLEVFESIHLPGPGTPFPTLDSAELAGMIDLAWLVEQTELRRLDAMASGERIHGAEALYEGAGRNRLPSLDLAVLAESGNLNRGNQILNYALPSANGEGGGNFYIETSLQFSFPLQNRDAKGQYAIAQAQYQDEIVARNNLIRNLEMNVSIAINNLLASSAVLAKTKESLDQYITAFENETEKFRNGLTTQLNLILFQERLTGAQIKYVQAKVDFANALAVLRFESGTIVSEDGADVLLPEEELLTLPTKN